jgi:uracil-DNA glycosylase
MGSSDLSTLLSEVRSCTLCPDLPLGPRPVVQVGSNARILIAGQAPGKRVHETGVPFDDPSGDRLRDWMDVSKETFYDPEQIAILPMGFCYPGTGKSGDLPPRPECPPAWREQLLSYLPDLELTLVIGQYAQAYHLGKSKRTLTEIVKDWQSFGPNIVPLPHPSPRNNRWLAKNPWFAEDLLPALSQRIQHILG